MLVLSESLRAAYREHLSRLERGVDAALATCGLDALVIHSGSLKARSEFDDQFWPLRPVPHFAHWLPLALPDCALELRPGRRPRLIVLREASFWEQSAPPESDHFWEAFEVVEAASLAAVGAALDPA